MSTGWPMLPYHVRLQCKVQVRMYKDHVLGAALLRHMLTLHIMTFAVPMPVINQEYNALF